MKKLIYLFLVLIFATSCGPTSKITKQQAYSNIYEQKPVSVLIMPPINRSTAVEAKEYFHSTLNVPIINKGYYVIPPFLSIDILKRESAYDAELFTERPLTIFKEIFGADLALFTVINKWDKSSVGSKVTVDVEYIFKSTITNEVVFNRKGTVIYNTAINTGNNLLVNMLASAINTAATKYVDVGRAVNNYTLSDLPSGKYDKEKYLKDQLELSGLKEFKVRLPK
jgi:hypothetical protein